MDSADEHYTEALFTKVTPTFKARFEDRCKIERRSGADLLRIAAEDYIDKMDEVKSK